MDRGRPPSLATRLLDGIVEVEAGLDVELRLVDSEYRQRLRRLGSLRREALALAQTLTAAFEQPKAA